MSASPSSLLAACVLAVTLASASAASLHVAQAQRAAPAKPAAPDEGLETRFWDAIKDRDSADDFQIYLDAYPDGRFAAQARARLQALRPRSPAPTTAPPVAPQPAPQPAAATAPGVVKDCPTCPAMAPIPAGSFTMGAAGMFPFEEPPHHVAIAAPFHIGQREVTLAEWRACVADGGCAFAPPNPSADGALPMSNVDWNDAHQYVAWLSKKTGKAYRLPSEAEWEYAARGGSRATYSWGAAMEKNRANCRGCECSAGGAPTPTGSFPPNGFGLYDMAGNVAEWVEDCWNESYRGAPADGSAWTKPRCQERVLRGGSFNNDPRSLRSAARFKYDFDVRYPGNGFRVARP